ncbi:MAG: adenylate/guanylate cyclase domain-containing protein [Spirochaetaceae bacterium]|nr:adenylate/guanylate cyclase domain-containing protein [Spirochaetaceae bacterium]
MLDPVLLNDMTEMLTKHLKPNQIDEIGRMLFKRYNSHERLGIDDHITIPRRKAAEALVDECLTSKKEEELIKCLIELDGSELLGKTVAFDSIETFMKDMVSSGYIYDFKKRKIKKLKDEQDELPNWGALREGKNYEITVASIDIVGNSALVKKYGMKKIEKVYAKFWSLLRRILAVYDGRTWSWSGDGGLVAFTFQDHPNRAVLFALELQNTLSVFNVNPSLPIDEAISLRIGLDTGNLKFTQNTGQIVSETINYAAHLEKTFTSPGKISISKELYYRISENLQLIFDCEGEFEGRTAFCTDSQVSVLAQMRN